MTRKVVLLSPCANQGGAERGLVYLAERLPRYGYQTLVVLLDQGPLEDWLAEAACPVTIIPSGRGRQVIRLGRTIMKLVNALDKDSVVISNQSKGHIYGGSAAKLAAIPEIWWQQQHPSRNRIDIAAAAIPSAAVVCSSQASVQAQRALTPHRRIDTIHLGTPVEKLADFRGTGAAIRTKHGWDGSRLVGIVGRLQPWKGQDVFLRAAALVARAVPDVRFLVVGGAILGWEGDYPERLRHLAEKLGIAAVTHFVGHQPHVYPWLDALDIVVHASFGEPFDHALIEPMALGKPLIASSKGGPAEIVVHRESGILVKPGDEEQMAAAIVELLRRPDIASAFGIAAHKRAQSFSADDMAEKFALLLEEFHPRSALAPSAIGTVRHQKGSRGNFTNAHEGGLSSRAMAAPRTHDVCQDLLDLPESGPILDIGAGQGAFSWRLKSSGYDVIALGISPTQFLVKEGVPYLKCDLDKGIPIQTNSVAGIVAVELIEHLESPLLLFREASRCLRKGGFFLLSTPNVLNMSSKLSFVLRDYMVQFNDKDFYSNGHISPLSLREVRRMASISGFEVEQVTYNVGKLPIPKIRHLLPLTANLFRTKLLGEILIVKLRRTSKEVVSRHRG